MFPTALIAIFMFAFLACAPAASEGQHYTDQPMGLPQLRDNKQYREAINGYKRLRARPGTPGWAKTASAYEMAELYAALDLITPARRKQALAAFAAGLSQERATMPTFHHVHLNSVDPRAAINFYTETFDVTKRVTVAGMQGVQSEKIYLLFNKVKRPPATTPDSPIWHFGWGSTQMESDYQRHVARGVEFHTPITKLNSGLLFAYMKAPDGALVEINTSNTRAFIHVHLYSDAPLCAADWYIKHLGAVRRGAERDGPCEVPFAAPSQPLGVIRSPAATVRIGEINLIIYPRQRQARLVSPRGHAVDHIAVGLPDLDAALDRLAKSGVKILEKPHRFGNSHMRAAMIEGPDSIAIELVGN
jgi:predicted enzyme related to lactoylglutathione lyase